MFMQDGPMTLVFAIMSDFEADISILKTQSLSRIFCPETVTLRRNL